MTPAELLRKAAANITDKTWCQGVTEDSLGRLCVLGHIAAIAPGTGAGWRESKGEAECALARVIHRDSPLVLPIVADWNDVAGRTAGDVRDLCLRAADGLEVTA